MIRAGEKIHEEACDEGAGRYYLPQECSVYLCSVEVKRKQVDFDQKNSEAMHFVKCVCNAWVACRETHSSLLELLESGSKAAVIHLPVQSEG